MGAGFVRLVYASRWHSLIMLPSTSRRGQRTMPISPERVVVPAAEIPGSGVRRLPADHPVSAGCLLFAGLAAEEQPEREVPVDADMF